MLKLEQTRQVYLENLTIQENMQENRQLEIHQQESAAAERYLQEQQFQRQADTETAIIGEACAAAAQAIETRMTTASDKLAALTQKFNAEQNPEQKAALRAQLNYFETMQEGLVALSNQVLQIQEVPAQNRQLSCTKIVDQLSRIEYQSEQLEKLNDHRLKKGYQSVEGALADAYRTVPTVPVAPPPPGQPQPVAAPHASRAKTLSDGGEDVLEFQMAGSGFKEFRKEKKGFHGKGQAEVANVTLSPKQEKDVKVRFYNRWFGFLPFVRNPEQVAEENARIKRQNHLHSIAKHRMEDTFGAAQTVGGQIHKHITKKIRAEEGHGTRTKVSIAGPLPLGGFLNAGTYKIQNTRNYMLEMASTYISNKLAPSLQGLASGRLTWNDIPPLNVAVRGHSRGAVSSFEGVQLIREWITRTYGAGLLDRVRFNVIQYDPVPGAGSYGDHAVADYARLGAGVTGTVVYSLRADTSLGFTPQLVKGAGRVILTPARHGVGLDQIDTAEETHMKSLSMKDQQGNEYRGSGISDLPDGMYILDEKNVLHPLPDAAIALTTLENVLKGASGQGGRTEVLEKAIKAYFGLPYE
jgi:hypothetical protein